MKEEYYEDHFPEQEEDNFQNIQKFIFKVLRKWYWILGSLIVALTIAYFVTKNADPVYEINASVLIKDQDKVRNTVTDIIFGEELLKTSSTVENEKFLITRYELVKETLQDLGYDVVIYYDDSPIEIELDTTSIYQPHGEWFSLRIKNRQNFILYSKNKDYPSLLEGKEFEFGKKIDLDGFKFVVNLNGTAYYKYLKNSDKKTYEEKEIFFEINNLNKLADYYVAALQVEPLEDKATILKISIESSWPQKEMDFINKLTQNYLKSGLKEKVATASQTMDFIDQQLAFISDSLHMVEGKLQDFKRKKTVDLSKEGNQLYQDINQLEKQRGELQIQMQYLTYLENYVKSDKDYEYVTAPSSMGMNDPVLNSLIGKLIEEQIKLKGAKTETKIENPTVKLAKQQIDGIRKNILETVNNLQRANRMAYNDLQQRIGSYNVQLKSLPAAERELINIERQHKLSETIYLFLMEKRTESGILRASTAPDYKVVNQARIANGGRPIKPKPILNYATAILLGLLIPVMFIYLGEKLNDKIFTQEELFSLTKIPLLGVVGENKTGDEVVANHSQSAVAESFRSVRSNLRYMADYGQPCKTFMVSSFVSGEGKTFCAKNLAYIFSITGKRTLYINTDLRKQNSYEEFGLSKTTGLSEYLIDVVPQQGIVHKTKFENLFVIPAGEIPPNPSELLLTEKFKDLIRVMKENFDYIIMDTPPRGILSDAMELIKFSDVEIFIIRQGFTTKQNVTNLNRMYLKDKAKHPIGIIFNGVNFSKLEYSLNYRNSYAYNYLAEEKMPWWRKALKI